MKSGVPRVWPRLKENEMYGCEGKKRREMGDKWSNEGRREKGRDQSGRNERTERRKEKKKGINRIPLTRFNPFDPEQIPAKFHQFSGEIHPTILEIVTILLLLHFSPMIRRKLGQIHGAWR